MCVYVCVDIAYVQSDISGTFHDFSPHDLSPAIWFLNYTLVDIVEKHAPKNNGLWLSEQLIRLPWDKHNAPLLLFT